MANPIEREHPAPPLGEEVHLPERSAIPMLCAFGITLSVIGITLGLPILILGLIIFLASAIRWIADTRRDVAALPPDHGEH